MRICNELHENNKHKLDTFLCLFLTLSNTAHMHISFANQGCGLDITQPSCKRTNICQLVCFFIKFIRP